MISDDDLGHLRAAIDTSRAARDAGNGPYGAVLVAADGQVLATAGNTTAADHDVTAHAETNAVRMAGSIDAETLRAATLYASGEPCPMCAGAIFNAGIGRVVFALGRERLKALDPGMKDMGVGVVTLLAFARPPVIVEGPALENEAADVFTERVDRDKNAPVTTRSASKEGRSPPPR